MSENSHTEPTGLEIAVIGMSGRFPGAADTEQFWENLKNGVESITFFTREELEAEGISEDLLNNPKYIPAKGILTDVECFDSSFFGYTAVESELMDPQIRAFYECAWWALENAGYSPDTYEKNIGMFAGATNNRQWEVRAILSGKTATLGAFGSDHLIDRDFLSTRIAYRLNLRGPAITLKTACSTSLVAVDLACRMLLTGQCDIALAGGVSIPILGMIGYFYQEGMISSPDGHCRAFDAKSKGVVFSDGVGIAVLKRLEEAIDDGDNIWAVIKGTAINNDGSRKGSYSAPGVEGQADVIRAAQRIAEVEPETIDYVETHGTGTILGDPVEIEGLKLAFDTDKRRYCAIGSIKTNIGHLDTAAGIASFLKTVLAIHHKYIPPSLHFEKPNPKIDFENSPFYVNSKLQEWKRGNHPRRAGVSSFGVGGTNAHVVLEEAPEREPSSKSRKNQLIVLSAKTVNALDRVSENFREYLSRNPGINLADAAYTLQVGRSAFKHRQMLIASTVEEANSCLMPQENGASFDVEKVIRGVGADKDQIRPIFMFSGQGSQYVNMGLEIYNEEPDFAEEMDHCFTIFTNVTGYTIKDVLYPSSPNGLGHDEEKERINRTEMTQPVIFIFEYALARLLMKWGIVPYAMIGHSIGEYVAACLAGVFSLEDAIKLVSIRGKLMQKMPPGSMLSVPLPEAEVIPLLDADLELAAVNAPALCVVSGPGPAINRLEEKLNVKGIQARPLHTSHAFHSSMMEPILEEFAKEVAAVALNKPQIPYISNLTGEWIKIGEATDPAYWARHLRRAVRFADGLSELLKEENALLIEVGPGLSLSTFARQHPARKQGQPVVNLVRRPKENIPDNNYLLSKIGRLWLAGQVIDWKAFYSHERRYRVPLPLYPFQRQRFWISKDAYQSLGSNMGANGPKAKRKELAEWFYIPSWKRTIIPGPGTGKKQEPLNWLFFIDECGLGTQLAGELRKAGHHVITVTAGPGFGRKEDGGYEIDIRAEADYAFLLDALEKDGKVPHRIAHLWNVTRSDARQWGSEWDELYLENGFYSLLYLAKAIGKQNIREEVRLIVFTNRAQSALGNEELCPEKAVVMGPVNVIPQEFPNIVCRSVDIILPESGGREEQKLVQYLMREMGEIISLSEDKVVAYRENFRLVQAYEPAVVPDPGEIVPLLKEGGIYLITGGLGGIGLALARFLAEHYHARLILTGRSTLPGREEWDNWLISHPVDDPTSQKIRGVKELETLGAQVMVCSVDATDYEGMAEMLEQAQAQLGHINGLIHAAGLPGGGIIQLKTREMAGRVLLPKVRGTLILESLLKKNPLDFILLCSSISSVVSDLGQVDYYAANAFMDAYAYYKTRVDDVFTVSVNWDAWQEVGMAMAAAKEAPGASIVVEPKPLENTHPMFEQYIPGVGDSRKYVGRLSLEKHWALKDHMTAEGKGLLPGTAYLEMARAAWESYAGSGPVEISDVNFLVPMMVNEGEVREVSLTLEKQAGEDFARFAVESTVPTEVNFIQKHTLGKIGPLKGEEPPALNLEEIKTRCNLREFVAAEKEEPKSRDEKSHGLLIFGPHWKTTRWTKLGKNEGLTMLQLTAAHVEELNQYKLHPSLLDSATGFMFSHIHKGSAYIPFSYKRLLMYRPFPDKITSYSRLKEDNNTRKEFLKFNVTIMDERGNICVEIEDFTMLEVSEDIKTRIKAKEHISSSPLPESASSAGGLNARQKHLLKFGIRPSEGVNVFTRILGSRIPQVIVSTVDLPQRLEIRKKSAAEKYKDAQPKGQSTTRLLRPDIGAAYATPRTDIEKRIAEIWQDHLGVDGIGINDDFFELGGDSLKAITLTGKIEKVMKVAVPLAEFFNRPTVKQLTEFISASAESKALMDIEPVEVKDYYVLSSAQERLFIMHTMAPMDTFYNLARGFELTGDIDIKHIESIFKKLINRHESLRTSFRVLNGNPVQTIHEHVNFELQYYDITGVHDGGNEFSRDFVQPFELDKAPLLRVGLVKTGEKKYMLVYDIHHIISDLHSLAVILNEDFRALSDGKEPAPLKIHYKDYAEWQNRRKESVELKKQEEFWLAQFKNTLPVMNLPLDFERTAQQNFNGDWVVFDIESPALKTFKEMLQVEEATLFMGMMAVYNILLFKLSGQDDIVVGTPIAGRKHPDLQDILGMFVNMLALRNSPGNKKTFSQFLKELKKNALDAFENQDYQFDDLVEKLALPRDPSRNPLFDVNYILQTVDRKKTQTDSFKRSPVELETQSSKFDLSLEAIEIGDILKCKFEYKTSLFKRETIQRFADYFREILHAVTLDKNILLKDIEITHGLMEPEAKKPGIEFKF